MIYLIPVYIYILATIFIDIKNLSKIKRNIAFFCNKLYPRNLARRTLIYHFLPCERNINLYKLKNRIVLLNYRISMNVVWLNIYSPLYNSTGNSFTWTLTAIYISLFLSYDGKCFLIKFYWNIISWNDIFRHFIFRFMVFVKI